MAKKPKHIGAYTTDKLVVTRVNPPGYEPQTRPDRPKAKDIYDNVNKNSDGGPTGGFSGPDQIRD